MYLALLLFVMIATLTPGGATALATASGVHFGFRHSVPLIFGIALGLASLAAVSAVGLGVVLRAAPALMWLMKTIGTAYLLFLAWRIAASGSPADMAASRVPLSAWSGALLLWLNPKAWAMTLGAAASFSALSGSACWLAGILGTAFGVAALISLSLWCAVGRTLARILRTEQHWRRANIALGTLLAISIVPIWLG